MKKGPFFIILLLLVVWMWMPAVCFGGEIFLNYSEERVSVGALPEYEEAFSFSFVKSKEEIKNPSEGFYKFLESLNKTLWGEDDPKKVLKKIQGYVNSLGHSNEKEDFWQSIEQTVKDGGDCDDAAIAKSALVLFFLPDAEVFLVQGRKDRNFFVGEDHLVVVVKIQEEVFVLDDDSGRDGDEVVDAEAFCTYFTPYLAIEVRSGNFSLLLSERQPASLLACYEGE